MPTFLELIETYRAASEELDDIPNEHAGTTRHELALEHAHLAAFSLSDYILAHTDLVTFEELKAHHAHHHGKTLVEHIGEHTTRLAAETDAINNANAHEHKKPNMRTLWEEVSEATLSWRGKHEHPLRLELVQIAGICINMIRQIDAGENFKP